MLWVAGFFKPAKAQQDNNDRGGNGKGKAKQSTDSADHLNGITEDDVSALAPAYISALSDGDAAAPGDTGRTAPAEDISDAEAADRAAAGEARYMHFLLLQSL